MPPIWQVRLAAKTPAVLRATRVTPLLEQAHAAMAQMLGESEAALDEARAASPRLHLLGHRLLLEPSHDACVARSVASMHREM